MYLKTLTLKGFKSFASATTLHFEPGVTCVVGPNGSGKSNVVDALSWVMGEQGAKSLRGGKMEDVIFAGTSARPPLGRAEVSLVIDNSDGALPIEYTEVTISRTMFRSGGSEYAINGHPARLLDVQELLSDSGIGREMHVIVGQGQLDTILQATPEIRRGFIEEAAGVLKYRKRREKAERKLNATEGNLTRLKDLISEIRRQLKPLGRQAEVARKASVIQAQLRDSKARLLADDLSAATALLEAELADEEARQKAQDTATQALEMAKQAEAQAESVLEEATPKQNAAQEMWYHLAGLSERFNSTASIAGERMRHIDAQVQVPGGAGDPEELAESAREAQAELAELTADSKQKTELLVARQDELAETESAYQAAEAELARMQRAAADRREGLARLTGQVNGAKSRLEASDAELARLNRVLAQAQERAGEAQAEFTALESSIAGLDAGESDLDAAYERAAERAEKLTAEQASGASEIEELNRQLASWESRIEALELSLDRSDGGTHLLESGSKSVLGSVAKLIQIEPGFEAAVAVALGGVAEGVAVSDLSAAGESLELLHGSDAGRASLLIAGVETDSRSWPNLPPGATYAIDLIDADPRIAGALTKLLDRVVIVEDQSTAQEMTLALPETRVVTRSGDVWSQWFAAGGGAKKQTSIELVAALQQAQDAREVVSHKLERLKFRSSELAAKLEDASADAEVALAKLHESDAQLSGIAEQLGRLNQQAQNARNEAERTSAAIADATTQRAELAEKLADLTSRLELASGESEIVDPDRTARDELATAARQARAAEMDARLAVRTVEERIRAVKGRVESLETARQRATEALSAAKAAAERRRADAETATKVAKAVDWLRIVLDGYRREADVVRAAAEAERNQAEQAVRESRAATRQAESDLAEISSGAHKEEMARIEQRMRIESLTARAQNELGVTADELLAEYHPALPVPVFVTEDGLPVPADGPQPEPVPYVRGEQEKRLKEAERNLSVLGRVNPLAMEEFDALQERHQFLAEQYDDLVKTKADLVDMIQEVDSRVQEVFSSAFEDVAKAFERVFDRLFPGGAGRLVLTEPNDLLVTGVEVEARPPGKKIKRLSLLSGGERSLVAVAFLVSLFLARPSPFYILDEVEAALDDTNLGRLLEIYQELRENSQLLVITHQKRTMEIADSLYGVSMRGDGVTTVISQRLRDG